MKSLYTHKKSNITKTWLLLIAFFGFILAIGYVLSVYLQSPAILVGASFFSIFSSVGSYWFSDKLALSMSDAKLVERRDAKELYEIVDNLAITAGLPTPKIYIMEDKALNAFATGRNPEHGVIVFTRGLIDRLDKEELRGVAAHELSHIGNRDILIGTIAIVLASAIAMVGRFMHFGSLGNSRSRSGGSAVTGIIALFLVLLAPLLATLLRLAISRKREYLADASGAMLTRYPEGLARALEKIGGDHRPLKNARESTAHLFISNPFKSRALGSLLQTHPPIQERIARLRGADRDVAIGE